MKLLAGLAVTAALLTTANANPITFAAACPVTITGNCLVSTGFEGNNGGWSGVTANSDVAGFPVIQSLAVTYHPTGGNGGGFISLADADAYNTMFVAPSAFLGNISWAVNGTLKFDTITNATPDYSGPVVSIKGNGLTLIYVVPQPATNQWSTVAVQLAPSANWHLDTMTGAAPTLANFQTAFSGATALWISAENHSGVTEITGLDNVSLSCSQVPEPASILLAFAGLGLLAFRRLVN